MFNSNGFFYHSTIRSVVVTFGSMFSNIRLKRFSGTSTVQDIRVPIAYGSKVGFLRRLQQDPNLDAMTQIDLPRLAFTVDSYTYDSTRRVNKLQTLKTTEGAVKQQHSPVPYDINMKLYAMTKTYEDGLMIVEQIVPFFGPEYTPTINVVPEMEVKQDVPFILKGTTVENANDTVGFEKLSVIVHTFDFTAKVNLFGPVTPAGIIKATAIDLGEQFGTFNANVIPPEANLDEPHDVVLSRT